jgi:glycerol-3-phosphate acyltransferase PlsX
MGGDHGAEVVVPAAQEYLDKESSVDLILVGIEEEIQKHLKNRQRHGERLQILNATEQVGMDELPSKALRGKKDSSMRVAINLVKQGTADACVSAGNTGALMAIARFVLKMLPNIDRPAIISAIPSIQGHTWVLDLGANVDCHAEALFQFAVMGGELVSSVDDVESPRIGLLNIGQEEIKGNEQVKVAHELLSDSSLNYVGYVEGDDIYKGGIDVVVCDGFVGNVSLKSSEGVAKMFTHFLKKEFAKNVFTRMAGLIALPTLRKLHHSIDWRRYNGACLLGLQGIVIKSHGGADVLAFENAIGIAKKEVIKRVPDRIVHGVEEQFMNRNGA